MLRDGEPGEPEVTLSPLAYHYQHRAALAANRTLGGLCGWVEAEAPRPVDLPVDGAASLKAAVIIVVLHYSTADQLA